MLTIEFKQVSMAADREGSKISLINLVDLAGSEKADQSGATGDRLKEGCSINKSLSALGNVIERLADKSQGKSKPGSIIPYRDSKLTRLLQNALGGSSKTVMICAISPAASNYEETLSTLRYADRAKRIKNVATVNEDPQDALIRKLREENTKLKDMIDGTGAGPSSTELEAKQSEISLLEAALKEMEREFAERLKEAQRYKERVGSEKKPRTDLTLPHIANLNEDPQLTNRLHFTFPVGVTRIGRSSGGEEEGGPQVALAGPGIHRDHATVLNEGKAGACRLVPRNESAETTFVNGQSVAAPVKLTHGDRIAFGRCIFVFVDPKVGSAVELLSSGTVSHELAWKELAERGSISKAPAENSEEFERRIQEAEEAKLAAVEESSALLRQREEEHLQEVERLRAKWEEQLRETASFAKAEEQRAAEVERLQREFEERQRAAEVESQKQIASLEERVHEMRHQKQHSLDMKLLEERLMVVLPLVKEANLIAMELGKPHRLETRMHLQPEEDADVGCVRVVAAVHCEGAVLYEWPPETLENRVFLMRELLERMDEEGAETPPELADEEDPFWDPIDAERLIGVAQVLLEGLAMQVENEVDARILSTEGEQAGALRVEIWPVGSGGLPGIPDEELAEEPKDLVGTCMRLLVRVVRASGLPEALAHDVRVEFDYFMDPAPHRVPGLAGPCTSPVFDFERPFVQDPVTSRFLEYLQSRSMVFRVYGRDACADRVALQRGAAPVAVATTPEAGCYAPAVSSSSITSEPSPGFPGAFVGDGEEEAPTSPGPSPASPAVPRQASPVEAPTISKVRLSTSEAEAARHAPSNPKGAQGSKACAIL